MQAVQLREIPLDEIDVDVDANPRTELDKERLAELTASVKQHGVLQPVLVREEDGRFKLVAGQRRYRAATAAGLKAIPAVVRDLNGGARAVALVENLQREDLNPIEEAAAFKAAIDTGMTVKQLAKACSVSEQLVKDRLTLLELPGAVQQQVAGGGLTIGAAAALKVIAGAGEKVVAKAAQLIAEGRAADTWGDPITAKDLEDDPAWVLEQTLDELRGDGETDLPFLVDAHAHMAGVEWPEGSGGAAVVEKAKQLPEYDRDSYPSVRANALRLDEDDVDAARAFGCLLEVPSRRGYRKGAYVTDPVWLADRLLQRVEKELKQQAARAKREAKKAGVKVAAGDDPAKALKEQQRLERAAEKAETLSARERNLTLGRALYKELHAPKPTADGMRLIGLMLLQYAGEDLGRRGLRFVDEASQTVTRKKDGSISRVTHLRGTGECRELLARAIGRAKTPEQIYGVLLQAFVAAQFAEVQAAASSDRYGYVRGLGDHHGYGQTKEIVALVEKIAEPVLPRAVVEKLQARRAEQEQRYAAELEQTIADVRQGSNVCPACGSASRFSDGGKTKFEPCSCSDAEITAALEACPRCGEEDCWASCSGFEPEAEVDE